MTLEVPFVGRETQLGGLVSAVEATERGEGVVAFVGGEAGIGKTRLVTEAAARVRSPVVWSRCSEDDGTPAYWPWLQLFRALVTTSDPAAHAPIGDGREELRRLLAEAPAFDITDESARFRLFDAVVDLLCSVAGHGALVLVFDDLHWADEPSIRLLRFIGRDPRARRLAIIATYRDSDLADTHPLVECIADLAHRGLHVSLGGLGRRDVGALAGALTSGQSVSSSTVSLLHRRTGGNPLFLRELVRLLEADRGLDDLARDGVGAAIPASVSAVVAQRLARLAPSIREVLAAAAVIGPAIDIGTLTTVSDRPHDDVLTAVDAAGSARLLEQTHDGVGFEFVHAVVREVLYDGLTLAARTSLHRRMALVLEARGDDRLPELAHHLLQGAVGGDDRERAVECAIRAGTQAMQVLAYEDAAMWFARALDAMRVAAADDRNRGDLLLKLGEAALASGDLPRARDAYQQAAALAQRQRDPEQLAEAALGLGAGLGGFEVELLDPVQVELLEQALDTLDPAPSVLRTWVQARLSVALSFMESEDRRRALSEEAVAMGREVGDSRALGYALAAHCDVIAGPDDCETRRSESEEVIRLGRESGDRRLELLGRRLWLVALLELGYVAEADAGIEQFAQTAVSLRQPLYRWYVPLWRGMRALMRREFDEAARRRAEAEALGARTGSGNAVVLTFTQWWVQQRYEASFGEAGAAMAEMLDREIGSTPPVTTGPRAVAAVQVGDHDKARVLLRQWRSARVYERVRDSEWLPESAQLAEVAVVVGARDEAEILYAQLRPYSTRFCVEGIGAAVTGSVAWYLAMLARFLGNEAEAEAHERDARVAHQSIGLVGDPPPLTAPARTAHVTGNGVPSRSASLTREGATWAVSYAGRTVRLRDSKGLRDLAVLLARPGEDVHCLDLMGGHDVGSEPGPALDQQARRAYEARIRDLQDEIDEARAANDPLRAERAETELDALVQQLSEAFGLSGRSRATGSATERARSAVGWRIRAALRHVQEAHPDLGRHLKRLFTVEGVVRSTRRWPGRGRGLPRMEVTMISGSKCSGSGWSPIGR
ncbi:MAG: ATP-binding protein, partial [Acidimicrobiales bacterium]